MNARARWAGILVTGGSVAMAAGALDPLEGSVVILVGCGAVVAGTLLGHEGRRFLTQRLWNLGLIVFGVAALFALSAAGGIGGSKGHSAWWGLFVLPYLIGWSLGIWGPGVPRWLPILGLAIGLWYLGLATMVLRAPHPRPGSNWTAAVIGTYGVVTICGCAWRLTRCARSPELEPQAPRAA